MSVKRAAQIILVLYQRLLECGFADWLAAEIVARIATTGIISRHKELVINTLVNDINDSSVEIQKICGVDNSAFSILLLASIDAFHEADQPIY